MVANTGVNISRPKNKTYPNALANTHNTSYTTIINDLVKLLLPFIKQTQLEVFTSTNTNSTISQLEKQPINNKDIHISLSSLVNKASNPNIVPKTKILNSTAPNLTKENTDIGSEFLSISSTSQHCRSTSPTLNVIKHNSNKHKFQKAKSYKPKAKTK